MNAPANFPRHTPQRDGIFFVHWGVALALQGEGMGHPRLAPLSCEESGWGRGLPHDPISL